MEGRGFTLVEMMISLAVLAIVAAGATPGLRGFLRDCQRTATVDGLVHAIHAARRMAGLTGVPVELCPTLDGLGCSGQFLWNGDLLLQPVPAGRFAARVLPAPSRPSVQSVRANRSAITFAPLRPSATTASVTVCDDRGPAFARVVIVSRSGRPRVSERDASGRPPGCP